MTINEDFNNNGNWSDDFTQGGAASPDYLFKIDNDADGVADADDLDDDNDGILDTDESVCVTSTISGNALRFVYQQGVDNPANAAGPANNSGALMYDQNDTLILQLTDVLPAGTQYTIHWGQRPGEGGNSQLNIYEATSLGSYTANGNVRTPSNAFITDVVTTAVNTRFILLQSDNNRDTQVDAITYSYSGLVCFDRDTDGDNTPDRLDKDSDGDGIPDVIEAGGQARQTEPLQALTAQPTM